MNPFVRFLGVTDPADRRTLLNLPDGPFTSPAIREAMERQRRRVLDHPDGNSAGAREVLDAIAHAGTELLGTESPGEVMRSTVVPRADGPGADAPASPEPPSSERSAMPVDPRGPRRPESGGQFHRQAQPVGTGRQGGTTIEPTTIKLTTFDRSVLAALVSDGGWNARSRARLMSLASEFGVTMNGLMTVMTGLSTYARSSGHRFDVQEITAGAERMDLRRVRTTPTPRIIVDPVQDDAVRFRRFVSAAGVISLCVVLLYVTIRLLSPESVVTRPAKDDVARIVEPTPALAVPPRLGHVDDRAEHLFETTAMPSFLGETLPEAAKLAADRVPAELDTLDRVERAFSLDSEGSEALFRDLAVSVETLATGWLSIDETLRDEADRALARVLTQLRANGPGIERVLDMVKPVARRDDAPIALWQNAYRARTLAMIAESTRLPAAVTQSARQRCDEAFPSTDLVPRTASDGAAAAWLLSQSPELVRIVDVDEQVFDRWEAWFLALRKYATPVMYDRAIGVALRLMLESGRNLGREGPPLQIIGRLLAQLDLDSTSRSRQVVLGLFDNTDVPSRDLWIITSLLVQHGNATWWTEELVPDADASVQERQAMRDRLADAWPIGTVVDESLRDRPELDIAPDLRSRWLALAADISEPVDSLEQERTLARLAAAARLNAAASALARDDQSEAIDWMNEAEAAWSRLADLNEPVIDEESTQRQLPGFRRGMQRKPQRQLARPRPGQTIGSDGDWAVEFEQARRNGNEKIRLLEELRDSAGTDLGPKDAAVFVEQVYRGAPERVRELAQTVLISEFRWGPIVAMEILDQFRFDGLPRDVVRCLAQYANVSLVNDRGPDWLADMRLELLRHAMQVRRTTYDSTRDRLEQLTAWVDVVYAEHDALVRNEENPLVRPAQSSAASIRQRWQRIAELRMAPMPTPATLEALERRDQTRRRLVRGPMQAFVAEQLALVDLLAYITAAERPHRRDVIMQTLRDASETRATMRTISAQSLAIEQLLLRLWMIRIESHDDQQSMPESGAA